MPYLVLILAEIACSASWWTVRYAISASQPDMVRPHSGQRVGRRDGPVSTVVRLLMAVPSRLPSARVLIPAGCAVALVGASVIWSEPTATGTIIGLIILGAGVAPVFPALIGLTPHRLRQPRAAYVIGWQMASAGAGRLVIAALTGVLLGQFGLSKFGLILVVLLVVVLASNFLMDFLASRFRIHPVQARAS